MGESLSGKRPKIVLEALNNGKESINSVYICKKSSNLEPLRASPLEECEHALKYATK